jgi:hypothetical protein
MATSKSTSKRAAWTAGALVFSGRPDPVWEVKPSLGAKLERIWRSLKLEKVDPPPSPALGYRGCFLLGPREREWFAFGGVVTLRSARRAESRRDPSRKFERSLLPSAPAGLLPSWLDS